MKHFSRPRPMHGDAKQFLRIARMSQARKLWILLTALVVTHFPLPVRSAPPQISHTSPAAVTPGQTVKLDIIGKELKDVTNLWTSFPARVERDSRNAGDGEISYRITVPRSVQVGIGAIRLTTKQGISNLKLLMLDDISSVKSRGSNHEMGSAQPVVLPSAVDGANVAVKSNFYTFAARSGERLSVDVFAQRLASPLDPVVRLLDGEGKELAYSDDEPAVGSDARLSYVVPRDGQYYLEVHDVQNRGGDDYRYRVRLGHFPLATVAFPLGGRSGSITTFDVYGPAVDGVLPVTVQLPNGDHAGSVSLGVQFPGRAGSGFVSVSTGTCRDAVESEPNDQPEEATGIEIPCAINGRFAQGEDRDFFEFKAHKGEQFVFRGATRTLGSPSDLYIRLYRTDGGMLVEAEDSGKNEGSFAHTFADDGVYRLMIEDLLRRGGPDFAYRVEIEPRKPGFTLAMDLESATVPHGGTFATKVTAVRTDYDGPIELGIVGAGEDLGLENNTIPKGKNETQLRVTLPARHAPGSLLLARMVGRAKIQDADWVATASGLDAVRKALARVPYPPESLAGQIAVGVGPAFPPFFELAVEGDHAYFPQLVGASEFKVTVKRLNKDFKEKLAIAVEGLPEGVTVEVEPVEKGETAYLVKQKGPESLAEGVHTIRIVGTGTFQNQTKRVVLEEVPWQVIRPLRVMIEPAGPIARGGRQSAKLRVVRFGEEKHPVSIRWQNGPLGIAAPIQTTLPADQSEIDIELMAANDAPIGTHDNLVVTATTKVKDQDIAAESAAASLVVTEVEPEKPSPQKDESKEDEKEDKEEKPAD